jgi:hypothetical protein
VHTNRNARPCQKQPPSWVLRLLIGDDAPKSEPGPPRRRHLKLFRPAPEAPVYQPGRNAPLRAKVKRVCGHVLGGATR